ncbi:unnamed protein product [Durusdinium trenchii]|uniref:Uncharacterized protein n=2 Tax=Durusdinium trenchii TaxID=1381693 RepID=A0ABP0KP12_9DINO
MKRVWLVFVLEAAVAVATRPGADTWNEPGALDADASPADEEVRRHHRHHRHHRSKTVEPEPEEQDEPEQKVSFSQSEAQPRSDETSSASGGFMVDQATLQKFGLNQSSFEEIVRQQHDRGDPNMPPLQPSLPELRAVTSSDKGFNILLKAYNFVRPLRAKGQNVVASLLMVNDADNCLMKLAYSTYRMDHEDEDDYPYLPRKCGDDFRWDRPL